MLTNEEHDKLVERFLTGAMNADELQKFTDILEHDPGVRKLLERESGVESLLHGSGSTSLADRRFDRALNTAVGTATRRTVALPWMHLYALAASLLLVIMGMYLFTGRAVNRSDSTVAGISPHHVVQCPAEHGGKAIMRLTAHTLVLSEEGSRVKLVNGNDGAVHVVVSQGNICIEVDKKESLQITVATPHSAIVLSGAVTRVVVTELETEVAMLEGSAEVIHRYNRESRQLLTAGYTVLANYDEVTPVAALAPEVCENRTVLFRKYVTWVQKQAHG